MPSTSEPSLLCLYTFLCLPLLLLPLPLPLPSHPSLLQAGLNCNRTLRPTLLPTLLAAVSSAASGMASRQPIHQWSSPRFLAESVVGHRDGNGTTSQACLLCGEPAADTRHHLLLYCPSFERRRSELILKLIRAPNQLGSISSSAISRPPIVNLPSLSGSPSPSPFPLFFTEFPF